MKYALVHPDGSVAMRIDCSEIGVYGSDLPHRVANALADEFEESPLRVREVREGATPRPGRECIRCGYVTHNNEVGREVPRGRCPECGGQLGRGGEHGD